MDFRANAKQLLKNAARLEVASLNLNDEITMLEESKYAVSCGCSGSPITGSGCNRYEERLVNLICLCDKLRDRRNSVNTDLERLKRGMSVLSDYEKDLLVGFYTEVGAPINASEPSKTNKKDAPALEAKASAAEKLMSRHHKERSTIYRDKDKALSKFTQALYGVE